MNILSSCMMNNIKINAKNDSKYKKMNKIRVKYVKGHYIKEI